MTGRAQHNAAQHCSGAGVLAAVSVSTACPHPPSGIAVCCKRCSQADSRCVPIAARLKQRPAPEPSSVLCAAGQLLMTQPLMQLRPDGTADAGTCKQQASSRRLHTTQPRLRPATQGASAHLQLERDAAHRAALDALHQVLQTKRRQGEARQRCW
jgi:hypothetical protein